jgi:hypothetical protein
VKRRPAGRLLTRERQERVVLAVSFGAIRAKGRGSNDDRADV